MSDLILFDETKTKSLMEACTQLSRSSLVPSNLRGKPQDLFLIIKMGSEMGLQEIQSLQAIHVIQGRPSMSAQTMMAMIRSKFPQAVISFTQDEKKKLVTCTMSRAKDDTPFTSEWDINKAHAMGLTNKDNWRKQPMTMLRWRAVTEAARIVFPDVIMGLYSPDEVEEIAEQEEREVRIVENEKEEFEKVQQKTLEAVKEFKEQKDPKTREGGGYKIPLGGFQGKMLSEIPFKELEEYYSQISSYSDGSVKLSQAQLEMIEAIGKFLGV